MNVMAAALVEAVTSNASRASKARALMLVPNHVARSICQRERAPYVIVAGTSWRARRAWPTVRTRRKV